MRRVQLPLLRSAVVVGVAYALGVFGCGGGGGGVNTPPTASFTVVPTAGTTQTVFQVDASASTDRETARAALEVRWDWDDDGVWDTQWSTIKTASHSYQTPGTKTIRLEVRDDGSDDGGGTGGCGSSGSSPRRSSTTVRTVEVQAAFPNRPPVIQSLTATPTDVAPGASVSVICVATDPDGDTLTYIWTASGGVVTGSGSTVTWAAGQTGTYTITCVVSDGQAQVSRTVQVTVTETQIIVR